MNLRHPLMDLTPEQLSLLTDYERLILQANRRVNLVSRASNDDFRDRHIVHSLCIGLKPFPPGSRVADFGTGGGLPGIPLAIRFPDVNFVLIDSMLKKVTAVRLLVEALNLKNVEVWRGRAEEWPGKADYVVSRATVSLDLLWRWAKPKLAGRNDADDRCWEPGLICLKGGDLSEELEALHRADPESAARVSSLEAISGELAGKSIVWVGNKKSRKSSA